ncbi:MAG: dienelactone hydrolase family protein [Ignavibacteriae bacterium]|nr:dienelactone hydrolase family protein [Ignavibacteriota bacterium]MCB9214551.1 dienelactone hydrolase family protein [Ignavibacteria bacterium]
MNRIIVLGPICLLTLLISCGSNNEVSPPESDYLLGKNRFTTEVDGDTREYYVHVPESYDPSQPIPVVFMLHGTSGDGEKFYNISGWKELGEKENILTVFPSSWHYCIIDDGQVKNTTKWHSFPGGFDYCAGEVPRDDVKFLRQIIAELDEKFTIDAKHMYLAGFSNGGQMAFRCAVEMSDVFAAIVESGGSTATDTTATPQRKLPVTFMLGNSDDMWVGNDTTTVPLSQFETGLENLGIFRRIVHSHTSTFDFDTTYTMTGDTSTALIATYEGNPKGENRNFNFVLINGLDHQYPNGKNHWMNGAEKNWEWFKEFSLP